MEKLKEILAGSLGIIGYIIWSLLLVTILCFPIPYLNNPIWVDFIITFVIIMSIPFISVLMESVIWVWAFVVVLLEPIGVWSVVYFVAFAFYFFSTLLPRTINTIMLLFYLFKRD